MTWLRWRLRLAWARHQVNRLKSRLAANGGHPDIEWAHSRAVVHLLRTEDDRP